MSNDDRFYDITWHGFFKLLELLYRLAAIYIIAMHPITQLVITFAK